MSYFLEFHAEAFAELECATGDYEARQPDLGVRFRRIVESTCVAIVERPLLWHERTGGYRRVNLPGFPFFVAYIIDGNRILVIAVPHSRRRPDYWTHRMP